MTLPIGVQNLKCSFKKQKGRRKRRTHLSYKVLKCSFKIKSLRTREWQTGFRGHVCQKYGLISTKRLYSIHYVKYTRCSWSNWNGIYTINYIHMEKKEEQIEGGIKPRPNCRSNKVLNGLSHGLLESRTGNFNITIKNEKTDAPISERIDEITYFFF